MAFSLPFGPKKSASSSGGQLTNEQIALNTLAAGMISIKDIIAPPAIEVDFDYIKISNMFYRTLFVIGYPRFVGANWLAPLINFDHTMQISMLHYPVPSKDILDNLRRKIGEMEATIQSDMQKQKVIDPSVKVALEDALALQDQLVKGAERFFQFGLYITVPAESLDELNTISKQVESMLGSLLIIPKPATLLQEQAFVTTMPLGIDKINVTRNMDTTSLATTFPFTSSELTANEGIVYGLNEHNGSLIIFDRFTMENANMVIFAKSGAGKSYMVKLEAIRQMMFGTEIIAIDPENEYKTLCDSLDGQFINFSLNSGQVMNPFDLSGVYEEGENELGLKILSLHTLFRIIMGQLTPSEDALLDRALINTYKMKGITPDPSTQRKTPPLMEDLYKALMGMEETEARNLASRLEKFIKGSMMGIFNSQSNVDLKNQFTVFSIRDLEDELRPIAMYMIVDYIWTKIRKDMKRRILIVDEAWYMIKYPDSAMALFSIAKRCRKYYLGLTTITQDIEDFLHSEYGKAIVTNSSIQILLKQSPAAIPKIGETFFLSEGEKHFLLSTDVGEGLFFAGPNHVAMRVIASPDEHKVITTKPQDLEKMKQ